MSSRCLFLGTPDFAIPTLAAIYQHFSDQLIGVVTKPDAPKGRNLQLTPSPIKTWAMNQSLPIYTPETAKDLERVVMQLNPDLIVIIAFGMILPKRLTDFFYCVNVHASLLPKYRGASPLQSAILAQEAETGITLMHIDQGLDTGNIISQSKIPITSQDNLEKIHDKLALLGAEMILQFLQQKNNQAIIPEFPQDHIKASFCKKISKSDRIVTFLMQPNEFVARVKAFSPYPGAILQLETKQVKILDARVTTENTIELLQIQPEGKRPMSYPDYLRGNPKGLY